MSASNHIPHVKLIAPAAAAVLSVPPIEPQRACSRPLTKAERKAKKAKRKSRKAERQRRKAGRKARP